VGVRTFRAPHRLAALGLLLAVVAVGAACKPGPYPLDVLPEMHYQVSQRILEPDRLLPPPDSVPTTGRRPPLTFDQAAAIGNPVPRAPGLERGRQVFAVNCAACHGKDGHGQSVVAEHFRARGFVPPVDFSSARAQNRTDGELYWIIVNGLGNMPPFGDLLQDDDIWSAVYAIREVQGR
jgi:mono/diheme cytochrome c family protein